MGEVTVGRLFEPFFTTRVDGNGLGLATVREAVHEHGGAINVESALGVGSRFEVWLPCIPPTDPGPGDDRSGLLLGRGETVIVIDADRGQLLRHEEMLAALGYEPVGFGDVDTMLSTYRATPTRFDALMVCQSIPAATVIDLAAALHDVAPGFPILRAVASLDRICADGLLAEGISEIVHLPLVSTEIAAALTRSLALAQQRSILRA